MKSLSRFLMLAILVATLALVGCEGDDGSNGAPGADGVSTYQAAVDAGFIDPNEITEEEYYEALTGVVLAEPEHRVESCAVCHGDGAALSYDVLHPGPSEIPVIEIVSIASEAGANDSVTFNVFEEDGVTPITGLDLGDFRFYMADILPAGTATATTYTETIAPVTVFSTDQPARWLYERDRAGYMVGTLTENLDAVTGLPSGSYTYTFAADLADGANALSVPNMPVEPVFADYDSQQDYDANYADDFAEYEARLAAYNAALVAAPDFDLTHTQRLLIRVDTRSRGFDRTIGLVDFVIPADGASTTGLAALSRDIIDRSACTSCHGDPLEQAAHGGGYQEVAACVICHTPIGNTYGDEMQHSGAFAVNLFHKIHAAIPMPAFENRIDGKGYGAVKYPENIANCEKCHADNGQADALAWQNPSNVACGTCHGAVHGGNQPDANCLTCHGTSIAPSVAEAHEIVDPATYFGEVELSADANGDGVYEVGEAPIVTLTITDADGNVLDPTIETTGTPEFGGTPGFTRANLYVYGPRSMPVPVMKPGSTTDPDYDPAAGTPTQGTGFLASAAAGDPNVLTDTTAFKYQLLPVTEDMEPGTYAVMAYATDLSRTPVENRYRTSVSQFGWALTTFQVGAADETPLLAGDCTVCHEANVWGSMYHRGYFAEDGCIACHDLSGNHANWLGNRVHAVHSEQPQGDLLGPVDEWADITFPRNTNSCEACHNSGNNQYREDPNKYAPNCYGCHGATEGLQNHMIQNGADVFSSHE